VPLEAGAKLAVLGVLIERGSLADECTQFADAHKMRVGESGLMIPLGFAGMVNHSLDPNVEKQVEGTTLYLCTLRPIAAHEELFYTYSDYARDRFGLD
jgi:hypothetical protein